MANGDRRLARRDILKKLGVGGAVGFYVAAGATGPFTANLWDIGGTLLASAPDTLVADDCWHEVPFASAVAVAAGTAYVASYFSGSGFYPGVDGFFTAPLTVGSVTAPADSDPIAAPGNGRYIYSGVSAFPTLNFNTFNYFVTPVWV